jgi:hypothetical protein
MIFSHPITRWVTVQANCHNLKGRIIVFLLTRFLASPIEIANRQRETFKTAMKAANPLSERGGSFVAVFFLFFTASSEGKFTLAVVFVGLCEFLSAKERT